MIVGEETSPETREEIRAILKRWMERGRNAPAEELTQHEPNRTVNHPKSLSSVSPNIVNKTKPNPELAELEPLESEDTPATTADAGGRWDFDLAEFPIFSLYNNRRSTKGREPLVYKDTIRGPDGQPIERTWKAYPGPFGFGGASTQILLYDLLQLYCEQGATGSQIEFGTVRALLMRRGVRHPSKRDYERIRRDIDILRGYDFHATNAFYDRERRAYVDLKWRLFGSVFYFKPTANDLDQELPFGFIEVSSFLQQIAKTRGFFSLGFKNELFYTLKPLEQRLAIYLAKKFVSQQSHRRYVADLVRALPIETATEIDARKTIKRTANGLLAAEVPILASFHFEKNLVGKWMVVFHRKHRPRQDGDQYRYTKAALDPREREQVERIIEAVGGRADQAWWTQCVRRLGVGAVDRGLGLLKEARQEQQIDNPGGLLTWYFKEIAREYGVSLK